MRCCHGKRGTEELKIKKRGNLEYQDTGSTEEDEKILNQEY